MGTADHPQVAEEAANGDAADYFNHCRKDILRRVPTAVKRVLSVGCGAGATESELVRRGVNVVGIELNPAAAKQARSRGLTVLEGDATKITGELAERKFDCLIYADVLEHIVDPVAVLRSHVALLEKHGTVVVSVPNFRYFGVFWQLFVRGHVRYVDEGILDRTHVRLTTGRMVEEWFSLVGLRWIRTGYEIWGRRDWVISRCSLGLFREFAARQVIVVAEKD